MLRLTGKSVLVTGGAGFIAKHPVDRPLEESPNKAVDSLFLAKEANPDQAPRRVKRTHSWVKRLSLLLIRWGKKMDKYVATVRLAYTIIAFRAAGLLG